MEEVDWGMKLECRLFAFESCLSVWFVREEDVETKDRRLPKRRNRLPSSAPSFPPLDAPSFSSSPDEEEEEEEWGTGGN